MKLHSTAIVVGTCGFLLLGASNQASADLVYNSTVDFTAQGFGNEPRDLTLQATGQNKGTESGAVDVASGGGIAFGTPVASSLVFDSNGITNASGTTDMPNPLTAGLKYGIPTIGSLGITSANQIGVLFNATEPAGNSVDVTDLTLKFYTASGTLLGAIDGSYDFPTSIPGNGAAGFTFDVSSSEQAYVNGLLANGPTTTMALESTITNVAGGPDSFLIYNLGTGETGNGGGGGKSVDEPGSLPIVGLALLMLGVVRRRQKV